MESIARLTADLERTTTADLDEICDIARSTSVSDLADNIKLNLSACVAELKSLIEDRKRRRELDVRPDNHFIRVNNTVTVALYGADKNIRSVTSSKGVGYIAWNLAHKLNTSIENSLTVKSSNSSTDLALLALIHQCNEIQLKRVHVFSTTAHLKNMHNRISLTHLQNYQDRLGRDIPNSLVWKKIHTALNERNIIISSSHPPLPTPQLEPYNMLMAVAKTGARNKLDQL